MITIETQMVTKMWLMSLILSRDLPSCLPPPTSVERYIAVPLSATEQYLISSSGQVLWQDLFPLDTYGTFSLEIF